MTYTKIEKESIQLKAVTEAIDEIINHEVMTFSGKPGNVSVRFSSYTHKKFYNIMLVDFLSNLDKGIFDSTSSCLGVLRKVCDDPIFNVDNSVGHLRVGVYKLKSWLEAEVSIETWFPSIDLDVELKLKRLDFIKICGNTCKHSLGRLTKTAGDLRKIFKMNGRSISEEESLLALEDFHERFHDDILSYHASYLSEMINNIRWGIYFYLLPEFENSYRWIHRESGSYEYAVPKGINSQFARNCYWELMNEVRAKPFVKPFSTHEYMQTEY